MLLNQAKEEFKVYPKQSEELEEFISECGKIYKGEAPWVNEDDHIKTVNFAKSVASETARLATLAIGVKIDGSPRAEWLQQEMDKYYYSFRHWVEFAAGHGTVILKPNGDDVDCVLPDRFVITDTDGDEVRGAIFQDTKYDAQTEKWYTRLEYHRFDDNGRYVITNRCYVGDSESDTNTAVAIEKTPWGGIVEEATVEGAEKPLFSVLRMPEANNVAYNSPLGLPVFSQAITELEDLDIAYSRNALEIADSKRTVLLDSDRLMPTGTRVTTGLSLFKKQAESIGLPDYVKSVYGDGAGDVYHEINPTLATQTRIQGIDALLSQIGYKCGFSNGYFVFNQRSGVVTATQVEADDRRTIQFIKDVRDQIEKCVGDLVYALDKFADLYNYAPKGEYEITYDFGDITYNREEDRARWYGYVLGGHVPFWRYLVKFEGMSEEEAKEIAEQAREAQTAAIAGLTQPEEEE